MKASAIPAVLLAIGSLSLPACDRMHAQEKEHAEHEHGKIVVTTPLAKDVTLTQPYVCQIHSRRHIEVRALQEGYLEPIPVREGQSVKAGDVLFKVVPVLYKTRLDAELAEVKLAELELSYSQQLANDKTKVISQNEVALYEAKLAKAKAKAAQAEAELNFTVVRAPYDGIIDRLYQQQGSLVKKEDLLTTLSDNGVMWAYFNVPEARYLEYMAGLNQAGPATKGKDKDDDEDDDDHKGKGGRGDRQTSTKARSHGKDKAKGKDDDDKDDDKGKGTRVERQTIELVLAGGSKFPHAGTVAAIEGQFNNETGNIPFRADFPNPDGLLRHGQTGKVLINRTLAGATVIPQRATFEILDRRYVFVVDADHVVRQREVVIDHELEDIFVIKSGLGVNEKFVLEGVRQVRDGQKVEAEFRKPEEALANQKNPAE